MEHLFDVLEELVGGHGVGEGADEAGAGVGTEGGEDAALLQAEALGEGAVDAPGEVVQVGVGGIDGDAVLGKSEDGATEFALRGDAAQAGEDKGVVGDDEVEPQGDGFAGHVGREVEGHEGAAVGLVGMAEEEAGVVVVFLQFGEEGGVEVVDEVLDADGVVHAGVNGEVADLLCLEVFIFGVGHLVVEEGVVLLLGGDEVEGDGAAGVGGDGFAYGAAVPLGATGGVAGGGEPGGDAGGGADVEFLFELLPGLGVGCDEEDDVDFDGVVEAEAADLGHGDVGALCIALVERALRGDGQREEEG